MGRQKALTKVKKKTRGWKDEKIEEVRNNLQQYNYFYVLDFPNQRWSYINELRETLKPARLFAGKNSLVRMALQNAAKTNSIDGLAEVVQSLYGERCVLFSNDSPSDVLEYFANFRRSTFCRAGDVAPQTVVITEDAQILETLPTSVEPLLRSFGLPTFIDNERIRIRGGNYCICREGEIITPNASKLLKYLLISLGTSVVSVIGYWTDGAFLSVKEADMS